MGGIGDRFLADILGLVESGFGAIEGDVFGLTGILIAITFGLLGIRFALAGEEAKAVLVQFFFTLLYVGFLSWLIREWPTLYENVGTFFQGLGGAAGGVENAGEMFRRPSRVLESLDLAKAPIEGVIDELNGGPGMLWNSGKIISYTIALLFLEIGFFVIYVNLFFAIVEFHLVSLAAWPFIAFSVFKGSTFLAERPIGFVFAAGAKLFVMAMILGFSLNYFDNADFPAEPTINQAIETATMAFILMVLGFLVPVAAAALISGGPMLSAAVPMMMAAGTALAMKEAVTTARSIATSAPVRAVGSATAAAASRAGNSFGSSFAPGGAANVAMGAMRGGNAAKASAAAAAPAQRGAGAAAGMRASAARTAPRAHAPRGDFLQRVRNAIPSGTDGHASGNAPRLSDGM